MGGGLPPPPPPYLLATALPQTFVANPSKRTNCNHRNFDSVNQPSECLNFIVHAKVGPITTGMNLRFKIMKFPVLQEQRNVIRTATENEIAKPVKFYRKSDRMRISGISFDLSCVE